jgi:GTPase KRas protein
MHKLSLCRFGQKRRKQVHSAYNQKEDWKQEFRAQYEQYQTYVVPGTLTNGGEAQFVSASSRLTTIRLLMVGSVGSGRRELIQRFCENGDETDPRYFRLPGQVFSVQAKVGNKPTTIQLANSTTFEQSRDSKIKSADAFILVFSLDSTRTFREAMHMCRFLQEARLGENVPILLLGNKCDLPSGLREVSRERAQLFAKKSGCGYLETSARTGHNVNKALSSVALYVHHRRTAHSGRKSNQTCIVC